MNQKEIGTLNKFIIGITLILISSIFGCQERPKTTISDWVPYDESEEIAQNAENESIRLRYKLIQSQVTDKNVMLKSIENQLEYFNEEDYTALLPLIYEQDIPTIQNYVVDGKLSYELITKWYLYRIAKFENNKDTYLNGIIAVNPNAVMEAKLKDGSKAESDHPIYGIPVLLKDNINFEGLPTTAGAHVLKDNYTNDAFIVAQIKANGGIILGKTSLSEWANYNCLDCPNGFSAVGGQTLNSYGRKVFDTGGSSSGSGVSIAANYAPVAVGTETSGSILSPSSSSSLVGLKPTVGLLSRGGIVPISSTLDTPGPMTKSVIDNAILLSAMTGEDPKDIATADNPKHVEYWQNLSTASLKGMRFGINKSFLSDSIYLTNIKNLTSLGAITIVYEPEKIELNGFSTLLRGDMKLDLTTYLSEYGSSTLSVKNPADIVAYNIEDTIIRIPYGQGRFAGIVEEEISEKSLDSLRIALKEATTAFFENLIQEHKLDAILSKNNRGAGYAAAAKYPCLTVPMGYDDEGRPVGLTFIARPFEEDKLLMMAYAFEQGTKLRNPPAGY